MDNIAGRGFFAFLGHGVVLPARNRGLFLPLLILTGGLEAALLLGDVKGLLLVVARSAIKIANVLAAASAFSGGGADGRATVAAALRKAKGNVWGPVLTVAFGYVLQVSCDSAIAAMVRLMVVLLDYSIPLVFLDSLLMLLASLFAIYLTVVCSLAVVVSVAEPWRRGAGALSRAWRLMQGRRSQAVVYIVATCALSATVSPVYTLAVRWWPRNTASGVAAGVTYVLLRGAFEVFSVAVVTAYYFQCRESKKEEDDTMASHRYIKLPN